MYMQERLQTQFRHLFHVFKEMNSLLVYFSFCLKKFFLCVHVPVCKHDVVCAYDMVSICRSEGGFQYWSPFSTLRLPIVCCLVCVCVRACLQLHMPDQLAHRFLRILQSLRPTTNMGLQILYTGSGDSICIISTLFKAPSSQPEFCFLS